MANLQVLLCTFIFGFGVGILTHSLSRRLDQATFRYPLETDCVARGRPEVNLDPFPLPPCNSNRTSALYVFYGRPIRSVEGDTLFNSISTLLKSNFPGRVRVVIDEKRNQSIRDKMKPEFRHLLNDIELEVLKLPDLNNKELIPHSNKIRALQTRALIHGTDSDECTVSLDADTYIHPNAPWEKLLSILELHDVAVAHDCNVGIEDVPEFMNSWMPNTGVLALRNTPRTRLILGDWQRYFKPCNATHVSTCMPGTDQYPFLQLVAKHAARLHKLDNSWNCRVTLKEIGAGIENFPIYSLNVLSNKDLDVLGSKEETDSDGVSLSTTCGGHGECHILHGHWLKYPES